MGFARNAVVASLQHTGNDFEAALNCLLRGQFSDAVAQPQPPQPDVQMIDTTTKMISDPTPEAEPVKSDVKEEPTNPKDHLLHLDLYANIDSQVWNQMIELIQNTFMPVLSKHMAKVSITQKRMAVENLFSLVKEYHLNQDKKKEQTGV